MKTILGNFSGVRNYLSTHPRSVTQFRILVALTIWLAMTVLAAAVFRRSYGLCGPNLLDWGNADLELLDCAGRVAAIRAETIGWYFLLLPVPTLASPLGNFLASALAVLEVFIALFFLVNSAVPRW